MEVVLEKSPITATTSLSSANFWAILAASLGSSLESDCSSLTFTAGFLALYSSTACLTALLKLWPYCARSPVSGADNPSFTSLAAALAGAALPEVEGACEALPDAPF
ncbi:hypothetical protein D3C75_962100 [compost metagenome]